MATSPSRNEGARHGAQRPRKRQVLDQIIQGNSQTKEIARSLALSPRTWRFIAANVLHKWAPATRLISCARCSAARKHRAVTGLSQPKSPENPTERRGLAHPLAISFATARRRPALLLSQAEGGAVCLTDREHADQWQASLSFHLDVKQFAGLIKEITRSFFDAQHRMQPRAIATRQGHAVALYDFLRCTSNCARPQAAM
jgi:hypothetical protein